MCQGAKIYPKIISEIYYSIVDIRKKNLNSATRMNLEESIANYGGIERPVDNAQAMAFLGVCKTKLCAIKRAMGMPRRTCRFFLSQVVEWMKANPDFDPRTLPPRKRQGPRSLVARKCGER